MELAQQNTLAGMTGSRRVIKDRMGRIVEDIQAVREPHDGKIWFCRSTARSSTSLLPN